MSIEQQLILAIKNRRKITLVSGGCNRKIEPYLLYRSSNGQILLNGWQYDGESNSTPPPDWINVRLDSIEWVKIKEKTFGTTKQGYNPQSKAFKTVIAFVDQVLK
jgi:hypothetical protein